MLKTPSYTCLLTFFVFYLSVFQTTQAETDSHTLSKSQMQCLYQKSENLLTESTDPIVILLLCTKAITATEQRTPLPVIKPKISNQPDITANDILVLSHAQLHCFRQQFEELIKMKKNPLDISFTAECPATKNGTKP
ncbi:hypothetical protein QUF61_11605 [Candidatus Venteria ishoeyi]|uniref:hypothetical protein n=1 Tax=Candidatus Venteria ishoeyi TaxID=1899563 RepID=UPI0025A4D5E4|nr:hypothetical protein [Candidatus Venteria ishoeyi]MDM8547130.1 hypothetical protein [Candidatus Venteria ishoeyi]